ncbi:hypothetical protein [Streptomyces avicenniae]|uniref:hypothetical protein n=1 Tax=Streptomyces avicenniae TaxID=500153 RepID=UPI00069A206F|nr:hypothetical protein [Streptomyces avicenniae]
MDETQQIACRQQVQAPKGAEGCGAGHRTERRTGMPVVMSLAEAFGRPGTVRHRPIPERATPGH